MFKIIFFHGISAGVLASIAAIIYKRIHFFSTYADFSKVVNTGSIIGANILVCLLAAIGYWAMTKWLKSKADIVFNFTFTILSFASIMASFSITLPLDIKYPELFPGLTVPMHFFPALAWYTLKPLFINKASSPVAIK